MRVTSFRWLRPLVVLFLASTLMLARGGIPSEAAVNGTLRQVGNQQILNLWGSNYEMGYAHGYLMADKIRDLVDHYMIGTLANGNVTTYNNLLAFDASSGGFQWKQQYLDEIRGIADGMVASGKSLYVASLRRNIDSRDIRAFNLQDQFWFSCSSFGVWENASVGGDTILGRNFDFYYDTQGNIANYQIIIAYEPAGKPGFISLGWPGLVGIYTGLNESGVAVTANTGILDNPYGGPYHPVLEVFRDILETTTPYNFPTQPLSVVKSVHELTPEIIQVGIPFQGSGDPVYYVEESPDLDIVRYPSDTDPGYNFNVATNHMLKAVSPPSSGESVDRYQAIRNGLLGLLGSGDGKVDVPEAWGVLRNVADIVAPTLLSTVIRPNSMELDVSFAKLQDGRFTSAANSQPQTYTWPSLFPSHMLPDLMVQSIVANPATPGIGQPVAVTVTVKNQGYVDAGSYYLDFYQNLTSAPAAGQVGDVNCVKSGLAVGATDSCTFTVSFFTAGSYKMWAQVDTEQQVTELDDTNNVFGPQAITTGSSNITLNALSLNPASVTGGVNSLGTVTLSGAAPSGGVTVSLSDNSSAATVPVSVMVPGGSASATFTITTTPVTSSRSVTISAVYGGVIRTARLTVTPSTMGTLTVNPASVTGGSSSQGTVTLSGAAPSGGVVVSLSDTSTAVTVPASVTVPGGSSSATFTITTTGVTGSTTATISAVYSGVTKTATLTVTPPAAARTVSGTISPAPSGAGATLALTQGTVLVATVTAASNGTYSFPSVANGTYAITPIKAGFTFTPASASVTVNGADVTGVNFTATGLAIDVTTSTDIAQLPGSTIATPAFSTRAGNELLLAFIPASYIGAAPNITVTGVSGGGLTWTLVRRTNTQQGTAEIWRAFASAPLTNATVTATLSRNGGAAAAITVVAFAGVNSTTPVGAVGGGSAATGRPTASLTTQGTNSWVFGVGNDWDGAVARTVGANQTMVHQYLSSTGDTFWAQRQNATAQPAGTVVTINDTAPTNHQWNLSIVEVRR